jgi:y4mF family transcriptional regulator
MRIRNPRELGLLIREERTRRGLTQTALADAIGVRRQWVHQIEKGKESAEVGLVLRALHVLSLRLDVRPPIEPGGEVRGA